MDHGSHSLPKGVAKKHRLRRRPMTKSCSAPSEDLAKAGAKRRSPPDAVEGTEEDCGASSDRNRGPELEDRRCPEDWPAVSRTGVR
ncbi:hypothetical protein NDU88_005283 [Pleurodeles waltl]|uniref:Uncharacterized protein n=1 Tax=Pleurodeles waltl TaxID=8319 RepID=A0AAV7TAW6_PLEWA|nr:hypothetical protein NDU88_005283 [Pleurodeles waltl]